MKKLMMMTLMMCLVGMSYGQIFKKQISKEISFYKGVYITIDSVETSGFTYSFYDKLPIFENDYKVVYQTLNKSITSKDSLLGKIFIIDSIVTLQSNNYLKV